MGVMMEAPNTPPLIRRGVPYYEATTDEEVDFPKMRSGNTPKPSGEAECRFPKGVSHTLAPNDDYAQTEVE